MGRKICRVCALNSRLGDYYCFKVKLSHGNVHITLQMSSLFQIKHWMLAAARMVVVFLNCFVQNVWPGLGCKCFVLSSIIPFFCNIALQTGRRGALGRTAKRCFFCGFLSHIDGWGLFNPARIFRIIWFFFLWIAFGANTESYSDSIAVYKVASGAKKRNINWEVIEFKDSSQQQQSIANTKQ